MVCALAVIASILATRVIPLLPSYGYGNCDTEILHIFPKLTKTT